MIKVKLETTQLFKELGFKLPSVQTVGAAGIDMIACIESPISIAGQNESESLYRTVTEYVYNIPTGIKLAIPEGYFGLACPRSGLAFKHSVTLTNGPGIIDSDYRGEIVGIMINHGDKAITINPGDRIFQIIILPYPNIVLSEEDLDDTDRGEGGFGSTGMK